jgi:nucleotide-binding universal stress UspA family protein
MRILLVGTDFSESSTRAFAKACEIAEAMGEKVHLLHVLEPVDDPDSGDPETREFYRQLTERSHAKLQDELATNTRPVEVTTGVMIGRRVQVLRQVAEQLPADLLVLGSKPLSEDAPPRLGVSHQLALTSARPVLLVP